MWFVLFSRSVGGWNSSLHRGGCARGFLLPQRAATGDVDVEGEGRHEVQRGCHFQIGTGIAGK